MTAPIKNTFAEGTPKKATAWRESMGNLPGRQEVAVGLCVLMMVMPDESQTELFHFKDAHTSSSGSPEVTLPRVGAQVNLQFFPAVSGWSKICYFLELILLGPSSKQFQPALAQGQPCKHNEMISASRALGVLGGHPLCVSLCILA